MYRRSSQYIRRRAPGSRRGWSSRCASVRADCCGTGAERRGSRSAAGRHSGNPRRCPLMTNLRARSHPPPPHPLSSAHPPTSHPRRRARCRAQAPRGRSARPLCEGALRDQETPSAVADDALALTLLQRPVLSPHRGPHRLRMSLSPPCEATHPRPAAEHPGCRASRACEDWTGRPSDEQRAAGLMTSAAALLLRCKQARGRWQRTGRG
ncbi:hypothetical protein FA09DRAFT_257237 [Tilletiopsis washingtonensis]|uniref:Uncharacterized protein n=1 Tax=Tilletiopsis washingtonensis TaxID=58919 RepID=A0A316ZBE8_9BASI|nr:hypothetical protein FA09DRAFT_257237 [Tilletiopsis washingtonensis]PWN98871.1 hypothetical protein FA09DRAFT_257237 [Tilletiopsis washingtonensis]